MSDRELLEFAAKAASYQIEGEADKLVVFPGHFSGGFSIFNDVGGSSLWNPLTDDGDALRLAVKLNDYEPYKSRGGFRILAGLDAAKVRRSIVVAAAAIGKDLP